MIRTLEVRCSSLIARMRRWKGGSLFGSELVDVLRRRVYRPFPQSMQAKQGSCHCCRSTSILRSQCARYHRPSAFHFSPGINQRKEKKRKEGGVHIFSYFARSMLRSRLATSSCEFGFLIYLSFFPSLLHYSASYYSIFLDLYRSLAPLRSFARSPPGYTQRPTIKGRRGYPGCFCIPVRHSRVAPAHASLDHIQITQLCILGHHIVPPG